MRRKKKIQTWSPSPALSNERCRGKPGGALTTDQLPSSGGLKDAQTRFFDWKVGRLYAAVWKINTWNSKTCVRLRWSFWLDNRVNHIFFTTIWGICLIFSPTTKQTNLRKWRFGWKIFWGCWTKFTRIRKPRYTPILAYFGLGSCAMLSEDNPMNLDNVEKEWMILVEIIIVSCHQQVELLR